VNLARASELPSASAVVIVSNRQVACEVGGEAVMLQLDQGMYYGLNPVGARVWQLIQEPRRIDAIVEQLSQEFEVDCEQCLMDIRELVADLVRNRLVDVREEQPR
jgi:Coenzyme PQQ synthesis protein D (PqqD)